MDIHKPKPWAGWREFVKEIGTIVIGVLIALGAEQTVEWLSWQHRTQEAEAHLRDAFSRSTVITAQLHIATAPCDLEMLEKVRAALLAPGDDWRPPYVIQDTRGETLGMFEIPVASWPAEPWRNAQADGTVNHMSAKTQARYSAAFNKVTQAHEVNDLEAAVTNELGSLNAPRRLDSQSRSDYLRLVARAEADVRGMMVLSRQLLRQADRLGIKAVNPQSAEPSLKFHRSVCDQFHAGKTTIVVDLGQDGS